MDEIASSVKTAAVKHLDEKGLRIGGKTNWLQVVSTQTYTWYRVASKRKDIEVLFDITGVVVHDHWKPYDQLEDVNHALCNAHHLRELKALAEIDQESWAKSMSKLLLLACNYKHLYPKGIPKNIVARLGQLYQDLRKTYFKSHIPHPNCHRGGITERKNISEHKNRHKE